MVSRPTEAPNEYASEDFGRHAHGYVQQRVPGAFEFDYVSLALFNPLFQGSYQLGVDLAPHSGVQTTSGIA